MRSLFVRGAKRRLAPLVNPTHKVNERTYPVAAQIIEYPLLQCLD
jgi:hypothetical protein